MRPVIRRNPPSLIDTSGSCRTPLSSGLSAAGMEKTNSSHIKFKRNFSCQPTQNRQPPTSICKPPPLIARHRIIISKRLISARTAKAMPPRNTRLRRKNIAPQRANKRSPRIPPHNTKEVPGARRSVVATWGRHGAGRAFIPTRQMTDVPGKRVWGRRAQHAFA